MTLSRKYILSLILQPALFGLALAFFFLSRVIQLTPAILGSFAVIILISYGATGFILARYLYGYIETAERAIESGSASQEVSRCFEVTQVAIVAYWSASGLVFTALATFSVLTSTLGFIYFLTASLIVSSFGIAWGYFIAKKTLVEASEHLSEIVYSGRELPLGRKIAMVFIGFFIISSLALVQLISSKVASSLEEFAIANEQDRFDSLMDSASVSDNLDQETLSVLEEFIPEE